MKLFSWIFRIPIYLFALIVRQSKYSLKYLFSVPLKKEVQDYCENEYFQAYRHIEKAIELAKKFNLDNDYTVIDVGGSIGTTAKLLANALPKSKIFVFEPILSNYEILKNISISIKSIIPIHKAVGSKIQRSKINIASRISSSSIYDLNPNENSNIFSKILTKEKTEDIDITTLDSEFKNTDKISILKIDVQGFELEVLKGANNILGNTYIIALEMNNHDGYSGSPKYFEIDNFLREKGFKLFDLFPSTHDNGQLVEWDSIYLQSTLVK